MPKCLIINSKTINEKVIAKANDLLIKCPHKIIIITIPNIKDSKVELLNNIIDRSRTLVKIEGGYDKQRLKNDIGSKYIHKYSNLYTIDQVFLISVLLLDGAGFGISILIKVGSLKAVPKAIQVPGCNILILFTTSSVILGTISLI